MEQTDAINDIVRSLSEVTAELLSIDPEEFGPRRFELEKTRDELRQRAAAFNQGKDAHRSTPEIEAELGERQKQLAAMYDKVVDEERIQWSGAMTAPLGKAHGGTFSESRRRANGVDDLVLRIAELEQELASRQSD